jgi:hypothetical protein
MRQPVSAAQGYYQRKQSKQDPQWVRQRPRMTVVRTQTRTQGHVIKRPELDVPSAWLANRPGKSGVS